jgi:hypothetical protein
VHAQLGPSLPSTGSNFIVLKDSADRFYSSDSIYRQGNAYGYKTYMRWVSYWEDRLYYGNGQIANMDRRSFQTSTDRTNTQLCQGGGLGETWQAKGPFYFADQKLGMITAVYQHSTNLNLFLISGAIGGIFRSVDGGLNWQNTTEALNLPGMGVQQIIEHPTNGSIIAGTGNGFGMDYGTGIIISNDQGQTWTNYRITAGLTDPTISRVAVDPNDPNILYIQTN